MHRFFRLAVAVAVALALVAMGMGGAAAQASNDTDEQSAAVEDDPARDDPDEQAENTSRADLPGQPVDEDVRLLEWDFDSGTFTLTFANDGDRPTHVTISEASVKGKGVSQFAISRERLLPGETTVTMDVRSTEYGALTVTSSTSVREGRGIKVSTGRPDDDEAQDPFEAFGGESGVFTGVGLSILLAGGAAGWVLWREETGVIRA